MKRPLLATTFLATFAMLISAYPQSKGGGGGGSTPPADPAICYIKLSGSGANELYVTNADGTNTASIVKGPSGTVWNTQGPSFSPGGTSIAFMGFTFNQSYHLRVIDVAVQAGKPVGTNLRTILTTPQNPFSYSPKWSPLGDRIAVNVGGTICSLPPNGGVPTPLFSTPPMGAEIFAWSPDGSKMAVVAFRMLYIVDLATGAIEVIHSVLDPYHIVEVDWSRVSNRIAFRVLHSQMTGAARNTIWVIDVSPGGTAQLVYTGGMMPTWSPDDTQIAFSSDGMQRKVTLLTLASGALKTISKGTYDHFPDWRR